MKTTNCLFFLLFVLFLTSLDANEPLISKKKAPLSVALPLLKSIDHYAIVIGTGPTHMYAFIDPVCPRSREFVEMVLENKKMQKTYTYHFFYYELTRFHTKELIGTIYSAKRPSIMMKKVMVDKIDVPLITEISSDVEAEIDNISKVADTLDIYKRPYLFVVKPKKGNN